MRDAVNNSWRTAELGEVCTIVNGGTPKSKVAEYWGGEVQWLTPKDMGQMKGRQIGSTPRTISEQGLSGSSARLVPERSIILSTRAPIGHLAINTTPMAFNQGCRGLIPSDDLDHMFLYHFLDFSRDLLNSLGSGTTFKELSATTLKKVPIPLPPLEEQQRIVAILEEAFEGLDRARVNAEVNLQNARELRQSVLADAYEGRSSGTSTKAEWKQETLGAIFEIGSSKRVLQRQWQKEGIPFYRAREIVKLAKYGSVENDLFITENHFEELKEKHGVPSVGDLMVSAVGTLGACYVVQPNDKFYFKDASVLRFHPKMSVCSRFYQYAFQWDGLLDTVKKSDGATVGTLTISRAKGIRVPLPSLEEQHRIVSILDETFASLDAVKESFISKLQDLDDFRESLLQKAFAGELT